jgi:hypothetical protein
MIRSKSNRQHSFNSIEDLIKEFSMRNTKVIALFAGLLAAFSPSLTRAGLVSDNNTADFTTTVSLSNAPLNGTVAPGVTIQSSRFISESSGLAYPSDQTGIATLTLTFSSPLNYAGLDTGSDYGFPGSSQIQSVSVSNGDSSGTTGLSANSFYGFSDTTPFDSITFSVLSGSGESVVFSDFRYTATAVPEPTGLVMAGSGLLVCVLAVAWRRARLASA